MKIKDENSFVIPSGSFAVYSDSSYTLNYSVDDVHYTPYTEMTPAGENMLITNAPCGLHYKLVGNMGDAFVQY